MTGFSSRDEEERVGSSLGELRVNESGGSRPHMMLPHKYSTCQDKFEGNLEVIGGAGVRGGKEN